MTDAVLEGRPVEERRAQHHQRVEPAARLRDVLDDEVRREVVLEPLAVLEGVVHLGEGHGAGIEPAVEDVGNPTHGALARRIVGVRAGQIVDGGAVEVIGTNSEIGFDLVEGAVDIDPGMARVVALPDRNG